VLRVPHGCAGSPTVAVRVQLPHGITTVQPMRKPGWEIEIVREALDEPISDGHGGEITERVAEIHWTGGSLPDEFYDEFVFRTRLPDTPGARSTSPSCRNARRACTAGSRCRPKARIRATCPNLRPHSPRPTDGTTPGASRGAAPDRTEEAGHARCNACILLWLIAPAALAHAVLHGTEPEADAEIAEAPEEVVLRFNEPVVPGRGKAARRIRRRRRLRGRSPRPVCGSAGAAASCPGG
jgi:hypothetical protein